MSRRIGIVIGTRPEAIKLIPVYLGLKKIGDSDVEIIATGQHMELVDDIFQEFGISPNVQLNVMTENQTLSSLSSKLHLELGNLFTTEKYDLIIVQGDTTTSFIAGLEAFYHKIKIAHVEAGLRTSERLNPFPEELNRRLISRLADFHFCPTEQNKRVLESEKTEGFIEVVGNTVIDALIRIKDKVTNSPQLNKKYEYLRGFDKTILVTAHRRENFGDGLEQIFNSIREIALDNKSVCFVFPAHPNPHVQEKCEIIKGLNNVFIIDPVPYKELVFLMKQSWLVMTDSGGIQEEAPSLGLPVMVLREETERQEIIEAGCGVLVGTSSEKIVEWFNKFYEDENLYDEFSKAINPYGDGKAAYKIAQILQDKL